MQASVTITNTYLESNGKFLDEKMQSTTSFNFLSKMKRKMVKMVKTSKPVLVEAFNYSLISFLSLNGVLYGFAILIGLSYLRADFKYAKRLIMGPPLFIINSIINMFEFYGFPLRDFMKKSFSRRQIALSMEVDISDED